MNTTTKLTLPNGSRQRGAQLGRRDTLPSDSAAPIKLRLTRLRWVDGDYDQFGAYWGRTNRDYIYCARGEDAEHQEVHKFARARTRDEAKLAILEDIHGATFFDGPPREEAEPPIKLKRLGVTLNAPFEISARLCAALRIGGAWVSLDYDLLATARSQDNRRTVYRYFIDLPDGYEHAANDLKSGCGGGTLQEGFASLLTFLDCADEELFPKCVVVWAKQNSTELEILKCEVQDTKGLINETS